MSRLEIYLADNGVKASTVLAWLGVTIYGLPTQLRCPIHSGGNERHPSARIYEDDKFVWCYNCFKQFKPSEIWAFRQGCDRDKAAADILNRAPLDPNFRAELIQALENYEKAPSIEHLGPEFFLEQSLKKRFKVPYEEYRDWLTKVRIVENSCKELSRELGFELVWEVLFKNSNGSGTSRVGDKPAGIIPTSTGSV